MLKRYIDDTSADFIANPLSVILCIPLMIPSLRLWVGSRYAFAGYGSSWRGRPRPPVLSTDAASHCCDCWWGLPLISQTCEKRRSNDWGATRRLWTSSPRNSRREFARRGKLTFRVVSGLKCKCFTTSETYPCGGCGGLGGAQWIWTHRPRSDAKPPWISPLQLSLWSL